jgi:hypothetical protein
VSISGSGGTHILLKQPEEPLGNYTGELPKGIDVRGGKSKSGKGGYIVLPPSLHKSGMRYEWELGCHPKSVEVAQPPQWLLDVIGKQPQGEIQVEFKKCDSAIPVNRLSISNKIKQLINHEPTEADDRSENDQAVLVALCEVGLNDSQIKWVFDNFPIGVSGKYSEEGIGYLERSLSRARVWQKPWYEKEGISQAGDSRQMATPEVVTHVATPEVVTHVATPEVVTHVATPEVVTQEEPEPEDSGVPSQAIPGKIITPDEARVEQRTLTQTYRQGWHDALTGNPDLAKLWPNFILNETVSELYNLGFREDYQINDANYPALTVPYLDRNGDMLNVEYNVCNPPDGARRRKWETSSLPLFFTDAEASTGKLLLADDWDVAAYLYLKFGHALKDYEIVGLPDRAAAGSKGSAAGQLATLQQLLDGREEALFFWRPGRRDQAAWLQGRLGGTMRWCSLPGSPRKTLRETDYNINLNQLRRIMSYAGPVA